MSRVLGNIKQFVKTSGQIGVLKAAGKEANRLGVMPSKALRDMASTAMGTARSVNDALVAAGHGSKTLQNYGKQADAMGAKLQRADKVAQGVAQGDIGSIVTAASAVTIVHVSDKGALSSKSPFANLVGINNE